MKKALSFCAAFLVVAGCIQAPQTPDEVRVHPWTNEQAIDVNRSASAAIGTITNRARACMNFTVQTSITKPGQMSAILSDSYRTSRQGNSLVIEHNNPNNLGNPGWYPYLVADVTSTASGARATTYAGPGNGWIVDAIQAWAAGDTAPCPRTDFG
ncbi:hypothetical protein MWU60_10990 [Yoonia sp. F2084L]|uniref:hypothetical protein n=1 Tax=Yoonia sp. F2084L TaxID=2926419 RepID=UPI001FF35DA0|nr:hypothetical protein [Yoonia sp. F2084L]MCK0096096.1 hypothetical protein [Yoonia sp. F2084L]